MESDFEPFNQSKSYGGFYPSGSTELAYRSAMIDLAIRKDDINLLEQSIRMGWLAPDCCAFDNSHIVDYCENRGATSCANALRILGWPEWNS